ncbi:G-protein coupled receptors family 1 profile domain-containing protein [Caenorhabditis elegans]|uniref:G-protein coupled receptors family 1 profile domain-containing protein n=1 Tax=Caenorhabditis elegans TaxID=6239 RepID=Q9U312_CAEEL|nr:G-protein coupled receptors family 1 profile domain-containing protein [Caenorhabditis elegans]CAB60316.2 G-protein coupled receptors family 1 profile domain-containing protein [Caenorhabditis elegans]|eukprot:NP_502899.2 Serpentine Receptor, class V [Caenorhabditis elegans]
MSSLPASYWDLPVSNNSLTVSDHITFIVETVQFSIFCVTISIYLVIVWALIEAQNRRVEELSSPFFKLCLSTAGVDIWTLLTNYLGAMFPKWGWFVSVYLFLGNPYGRIYLYFAWSTGICQAMSVSVLASNRLSVMLFPTSFNRIWQEHRLWIAISIQYLIGLIIGLSTFLNDVQLFRNSKNGIVPRFLNKSMTNTFFAIGGVFLFVNCVYLVATYCYLFWVIRKRQRINMPPTPVITNSRSKAKMREARLFTMSTIIVGVQMCILILFIFKGADILAFTSDQFYLVYNAVSDLYASINPYLLWVFSDSLRKYILQRLGFTKKKLKITSVTPITFVQ